MFTFISICFLICINLCLGYEHDDPSCLNLVNDCGAKPNTSIDNTFSFYSCQQKLSQTNGGCVTVPNGIYKVFNVLLNTSNIVYYISSSVTFIPYIPPNTNTKQTPVFMIGSTTSYLKNISMIGYSNSNSSADDHYHDHAYHQFTINISNVVFTPWYVRGIQLIGIDGFTLSNIRVINNISFGEARSGIELDGNTVNDSNIDGNIILYHPKNGKIMNITTSGQPYGYGCIQLNSAENVSFENLDGTGGITLRIETNGYTNNIFGKNIICRNGHAAVMSAPHTTINGYFEVHNVISYSCYVGYIWSMGYDENNKTAGWFANGSIVDNVQSYYGVQAQIDANETGSSCGPCGIPNTKDAVNYIVNVTNLQSFDFPPPANRNSCPEWMQSFYQPVCPWDNSSLAFNVYK